LATGLATATSEGDPVLAIGGEVTVSERLKKVHQSLDSVALMKPITKYSAEIVTVDQIGEILGNAIRCAESGRQGAVFVSLPKDIGLSEYHGNSDLAWGKKINQGSGDLESINAAAELINQSQSPMIIFGMQASKSEYASQIKSFLEKTNIPYASTFQGPGIWAKPDKSNTFVGRLGLFNNQPADHVLAKADVVIAIGYDPIEYDASLWNDGNNRNLVVIDTIVADQDNNFMPSVEIVGNIAFILESLENKISVNIDDSFSQKAASAFAEVQSTISEGKSLNGFPVHPLRILDELQSIINKDTQLALDVGSHYIWMNRYYGAEFARQVLVSNGQQTLGVALPWAIASCLLHPTKRVVSVSGDGGFLFSSMELETAVRLGVKFIHVIWDSNSYDMVSFQEQAHYGDTSGVELGSYDVVAYAESFGCKGFTVNSANELHGILQQSLESDVPVLIHIPVDYSQNIKLMQDLTQNFLN
jgi:acetolactate synthase-1/2/3 large subunit